MSNLELAINEDGIRAAFARRIEPVRSSVPYRMGITGVAAAMSLLPVVYVLLIALAAFLCLVYVVVVLPPVFQHLNTKLIVLALAPLIAGVIGIVFLFKPLLARIPKSEDTVELRREDAPLLYALVESLSDALGSPRPERIEVDVRVNASASWRRGFWSMLSNDLALTIGLPLVNGLTLRQFTGVLAHEFGHFSQSAGMRLGFLIGTVNNWLYTSIYVRDSWDEKLTELSESDLGVLSFAGSAGKAGAFFSRLILRVLMMIGRLLSSYLQRQQEFDADQAAIRAVGSDASVSMMRRLPVLSLGEMWAHSRQQECWKNRRLGDDLPALIAAGSGKVGFVEDAAGQTAAKSGMYDSHPPANQRIARAEAQPWEGAFQLDGDATELFQDFPATCRAASKHFYLSLPETEFRGEHLVPVAQVLAATAESERFEQARKRVFGQAFDGVCWFRLPEPNAVGMEELKVLRASCGAELESAFNHVGRAALLLGQVEQMFVMDALTKAGVEVVGVSKDAAERAGKLADLDVLFDEAKVQARQACPSLLAFIAGALPLCPVHDVKRWMAFFNAMREAEPLFLRLVFEKRVLDVLRNHHAEGVDRAFAQQEGRVELALRKLTAVFAGIEIPEPGHDETTAEAHLLAKYEISARERGGYALARLIDLYVSTLGRIAAAAEAAAGM